VGVDSAWEQKKLEARKILETAQNPHRPLHAVLGGFFNLRGLFLRNPANKARKPHTLLVKALSQQAQLLETPVY